MSDKPVNGIRRRFMILVFLLFLLSYAPVRCQPLPGFQLHQIEDGTANAYLIFCDGIAMMVDTGCDKPAFHDKIFHYLKDSGLRKLDYIICTHWHRDHAGNLNEILSLYGTDATVVYGTSDAPHMSIGPLARGIYRRMRINDAVSFGPIDAVCVGPVGELSPALGDNNIDSLNIILSYGSRRFMFTGDYIEDLKVMTPERRSLLSGIDVFQFPHHGLEPYCVNGPLLEAIRPAYICVPGPEKAKLKRRFSEMVAPETVWVGNGDGNFVFHSDGISLDLYTHVQPGDFEPMPAD